MEELLVISGPPGSGKSAVASVIAERWQRSVLVEGDAFFGFLREGIDPWRPESDDQNRAVIEAVGAAAGRFAAHAVTVVEGVLGPWFLADLVAASGLRSVDYAVLLPPRAVCLDRVASRRDHAFTDLDVTGHLHGQFAAATVERRHVIALVDQVDHVADAVLAARAQGCLRWTLPT